MTLEHRNKVRNRMIILDASSEASVIRYLSGAVAVDSVRSVDSEELPTSIVTITRTGSFVDPRYGDFSITKLMLSSFIENFNNNVYGQDVPINVAHLSQNGAAGYIRKLFVENNKLRALVEWTNLGVDAIKNRGYRYLSAEYSENWQDNETRKFHGPTLLGAGLVVKPCLKHLDRVELSEHSSSECPTLISDRLFKQLSSEINTMWEALLKALREYLASINLTENLQGDLIKLAETQSALITDKSAAEAFVEQLKDTAKKLSEANAQSASITVQGGGVTKEDVVRLLAEQSAKSEQERADKAAHQAKLVTVLSEAINAAEGLSDDTKADLISDGKKLLKEHSTDGDAKALAEMQLKAGETREALRKLNSMGFDFPVGRVHVMDNPQSAGKKLQEMCHERLRRSGAYAAHSIKLKKEISPQVEKVLHDFDVAHASEIHQEIKMLEGESSISDSKLPVAFRRDVIRENLSDLNVLDLVMVQSDPQATVTTEVPYEIRDNSAVQNDGIVYEGQGIPRVKARTATDIAYINAMKVAIAVSNEALHFTRAAAINWDAWSANLATASRTMKELLHRRLANYMQRASDSYMSSTVNAEDIAAQLDGSTSLIKTAQFPIIQPFQQYDMKGTSVGAMKNPINLIIDGTPVQPYNGSGTQAAGTYYVVTNHNLGYITLVDESGALVTPNAAAAAITYDYTTNVVKLDSDLPVDTKLEVHLNSLLRGIGRRKAIMKDDRFVTPDFLLMTNTMNDTATNAEDFVSSYRRKGNEDSAMGDLEAIKGINSWETNAPGVHLGDERIMMGVRGTCAYTIAKPFVLSDIQEERNGDGQLTGRKEVYGEEYGSIHIPDPVADRFSSVLFYSFTNR